MTTSAPGITHRLIRAWLAWLLFASPGLGLAADGMNIEQRVACQVALEDIAWDETLWPKANPTSKPRRESVLSDAAIRARVEDQMRMEAALDADFGVRLDNAKLQAELNRVASRTRAPERLRQRFVALGDDADRIAECLVRPYLAGELLRRAYSADERRPATRLPDDTDKPVDFERWWAAQRDRWTVAPVVQPASKLTLPKIDGAHELDMSKAVAANSWRVGDTPSGRYDHSAVWTGTEMIVWGGRGASSAFNTGGRYNPASDTWVPTSIVAVPEVRSNHTAVWTGTEMIIWGGTGSNGSTRLGSGGRYNPVNNSWQPTLDDASSPSNRSQHTAVWTGTEMIVWGGMGTGAGTSGGRYNPTDDTWTPVNTTASPSDRRLHSAVWTGTEMIVWGGFGGGNSLNTGARYTPTTDSWTAATTTNAPAARTRHTAVWTGTQMIVWGGQDSSPSWVNSGGVYTPGSNSWSATSTGSNVPGARGSHTALWTGSQMIVWGGDSGTGTIFDSGSRYNPGNNTWSTISGTGRPGARASHSAVWTGTQMIVWGGENGLTHYDSGGRYTPGGTWTPTASNSTAPGDAPAARQQHSTVWTGVEMIIWGGRNGSSFLDTGGRYRPVTDAWLPTNPGNAPVARAVHTAVWTGTEMIIWGGADTDTTVRADGRRYNPMNDSWVATGSVSTPDARAGHTAVWSGTEMIVWGGIEGPNVLDSGGRYAPDGDTWTAIDEAGAPGGRALHSAVWAGDEMIVWGGRALADLNTGGRYNPGSNSWSDTSTTGAPSVRSLHTSVWTDSEMIVWGGDAAGTARGDGARYNPSDDSWNAMSGTGAPGARLLHSAVWTGSEMIIWGGLVSGTGASSGARYDPEGNAWVATTNTNAPSARFNHSGVWTGEEMIIWGGLNLAPLNTMGIYYPAAQQQSSTILQSLQPSPSLPGASVAVGVRVTGESSAPADGRVVVVASTGETCSDDSPQPIDTLRSGFGCDLVFATTGARTVTARFLDSATHFNSDASAVPHGVFNASGVAIDAVSPSPSNIAQSVGISFTVTGSSPTGTVSISSDLDGSLGGCTAIPIGTGMCTINAAGFSVGSHTLTAIYSGDINHAPATSPGRAHQVTLIGQNISNFVTSPANPQFLAGGTFTVSATGGPSGNPVTFSIAPASSSVCSISGATVTMLAMGNCVIQADQAGNASHTPAPQRLLVVDLFAVDLSISIDDARTTADHGDTLDYLVMLFNAGPNAANDVQVSVVLAPQLDAGQATWICNDAGTGQCSASGTGTLTDASVNIPINDSVSYVLSAPIRADAVGSPIVSTLSIISPDQVLDPVSDSTILVTVFRDSFED